MKVSAYFEQLPLGQAGCHHGAQLGRVRLLLPELDVRLQVAEEVVVLLNRCEEVLLRVVPLFAELENHHLQVSGGARDQLVQLPVVLLGRPLVRVDVGDVADLILRNLMDHRARVVRHSKRFEALGSAVRNDERVLVLDLLLHQFEVEDHVVPLLRDFLRSKAELVLLPRSQNHVALLDLQVLEQLDFEASELVLPTDDVHGLRDVVVLQPNKLLLLGRVLLYDFKRFLVIVQDGSSFLSLLQ